MNRALSLLCATCFALITPPVMAAEDAEPEVEKKIIIAVKSDDFELAETDISHLGVGDAETWHTEDGKTIDMLRTEDGVEVYIDGELLDLDRAAGVEPGVVHKHIRIVCGDEGETEACGDLEHLEDIDIDIDVEALGAEGQQVIVIREKHATGEPTDTAGEDAGHHVEGEEHKVIVIRKTVEEI